MYRKLTLLLLFAFGTLSLVAGTIERKLSAANCAHSEPDLGIYCPVKVGDNPNATCATDGNVTEELCKRDTAQYASSFYTNKSYTKYSKDNYPEIQWASVSPPIPSQTFCYLRTRCKWDDNKCVNGPTEWVYQLVYVKEKCPGP